MYTFLFRSLILMFLSIILISACNDSPEVVGKVGGERIYLPEFQEILRMEYRDKRMNEISFEERKEALLKALENRVKVVKAKKLNLQEKPEYHDFINIRQDRIIASKLPDILITDKFITEDMIQAYSTLQLAKPRVILLSLGYEGSKYLKAPRSLDETITLAEVILKQVRNGANLMNLTEQYSDDENGRKMRGIYDPFTPGVFDPLLDIELSMAKENQLLGPIKTPRGIFIAQVVSLNPVEDKPPVGGERDRIKWQIFNKFYRQEEGDRLHKELTEKFKSELGWEISDSGIEQFLAAIQIWEQGPRPSDNSFTDEQRAIYLGKIGNTTITVGSFIKEFQGAFSSNYIRFNNPVDMKKVLADYIERYLSWLIKAKEYKVQELPDVKYQMDKIENEKLAELLDKHEIQEKSTPTPEEIASYYQVNMSKYLEPRKIRVWEIAVKDREQAVKIHKNAVDNFSEFENLAQQYTEKTSMKSRKGDLGYQNANSPRSVIKAAFEAGENKIIGPLEENNFFYIIKTGDIQPERQKTLAEAEIVIKAAVQKEKQDRLRQQLIKDLQNEYVFWINESLLRKLS
jgi:parvulin-like peptidyl-prolyl isomerase